MTQFCEIIRFFFILRYLFEEFWTWFREWGIANLLYSYFSLCIRSFKSYVTFSRLILDPFFLLWHLVTQSSTLSDSSSNYKKADYINKKEVEIIKKIFFILFEFWLQKNVRNKRKTKNSEKCNIILWLTPSLLHVTFWWLCSDPPYPQSVTYYF